MPNRLNIKITCDVESLKIAHTAKDDLSFRRFLDIIAFVKIQCGGKSWPTESKIRVECEIDDTMFDHTVTDTQSFDRLFPLIDFIKSQHFNDSYSVFNIHTPVFIQRGECAGKFGIIANVYHEFFDQSDYDLTSLCLQVGDLTIWTAAENVVIADRLKIAQEQDGEFHGYPQDPPIEIKITKRSVDDPNYHVQVTDHKELWAAGTSEISAIGDLIAARPEYFGIQITRPDLENPPVTVEEIPVVSVDPLSEIDSIIECQSGIIKLPPAEPDPIENNAYADLIGRSVQLIPTGKEPKTEKYLLDKTLVIKNVINNEFALQFNDEAIVWRVRQGFIIVPDALGKEYDRIKNQKDIHEQEIKPMTKVFFKVNQYVKPKEGHIPSLAGIGKVKRVNMMSGDILVEFSNGMDWVPGTNYEITDPPEGSGS